jgi:hypothetical protein
VIKLTHKNLVLVPEVYDWVRDTFAERPETVRYNRRGKEETWRRYDRIWAAQLDRQSYHGRHKIYLAAGRRLLETVTDSVIAGFLPMTDWFSVTNIANVTDPEQAAAVQELQRHFLTKTMNLEAQLEPFVRQLVRLGTSPFKHVWHEDEKVARRLVRREDRRYTKGQRLDVVVKAMKTCYGPILRPVDLYSWYAWPETANDVDELLLVFEDKEVTHDAIRASARRWMDPDDEALGHMYERVEEALDRTTVAEEFKQARAEKLRQQGIYLDPTQRQLPATHAIVTECYWRGEIPGATHEDEDTGEEVTTGVTDWLITLVDSTFPIRIQRNPFFRPRAPFHVARTMRVVDEFYGHSMLEGNDRLQYLMNDLVNHTVDGLAMSMNGIVKIDPTGHARPNSLRLLPGAKWIVRPDAAVFDRPVDVSPSGWMGLNSIQGFFHDYGLNAASQGQPAARGRGRAQNTAGGMSMQIQQGSLPMQSILRMLSRDVGERILQWNMELAEQFMDEPIMIRILGKGAGALLQKPISVDDILGEYGFEWHGAQATQERVTLSAQMERLIPLLVQVQQMADQRAATQGGPKLEIDFAHLVKRIWTYGLQLHGADELVKTSDESPSLDPAIEDAMLQENRVVDVNPGDNDVQHLQSHHRARATASGYAAACFDDHIAKHEQQLMGKVQQVQQQAQMQQMAQLQMAMGGAAGSGGGMPGTAGMRPQSMPTGADPATEQADLARSMQMGPGV